MKKISLLAASVALALMGCGGSDGGSSDNSNTTAKAQKPSIAVPTKGEFIDAKVIGLDYVSGGTTGKTDVTGGYTIDQSNPEVSFYLGGKENGLFIGSVSGRHITTPFEAAGTHQRAVNLARLLLTIGEGTSTLIEAGNPVDSINLSTLDFTPEAVKIALNKAMLDDEASLKAIATALNNNIETALVTEEEATKHMEVSLKDIPRGSDVNLTHWSRGSNWTFVSRGSTQRIRNAPYIGNDNPKFDLVINVDRTLTDPEGNPRDLFEQTASMTFTLAEDSLTILKGSNDSSISGGYVADYLTCLDKGGVFEIKKDEDGNDKRTCNDEEITKNDDKYDYFYINSQFQYSFINPIKEQTSDETKSWAKMEEMGGSFECMANKGCTEQALSKFRVLERDDSDNQDGSAMRKETISGSYDPITDVYTNTTQKEYLTGKNEGRISESISFRYPVEAVGQDRYVDFIGTWEYRGMCSGGEITNMTMVFTADKIKKTGTECGEDIAQEIHTYNTLPKDFWWFGTNAAGVSKATLDQLNSTVRWNDKDSVNESNYIKINRFTYIPAGVNWDKGLLIRDTLSSNGTKESTITMKKI
ncbi:hypothetical protein ACU5EH_07500 [Aliivibrio salmonicida]|uniref:hypothetical protein n=1 Tax=Aliivibrio salmonicida TaxID=40269 RepID=UPI00406C0818